MSQVCEICRKPGAGLDARVLFPDLDVREHRLLDRAIHGECYSGWMYRKQFSAEFHEAARKAGRPELTLAADGTLHEGRPRVEILAPLWEGLGKRLKLVPFRGEGLVARVRHYERVMRVSAGLFLALFLATIGTFLTIRAWPVGLLVGGMLYIVAWIVAMYVWRWSPMILSQQPKRPWWL